MVQWSSMSESGWLTLSAPGAASLLATMLRNFLVLPCPHLWWKRWLTLLPVPIEVLWMVSAYNRTRTMPKTELPLWQCNRRQKRRACNRAVRHYKKEMWFIDCYSVEKKVWTFGLSRTWDMYSKVGTVPLNSGWVANVTSVLVLNCNLSCALWCTMHDTLSHLALHGTGFLLDGDSLRVLLLRHLCSLLRCAQPCVTALLACILHGCCAHSCHLIHSFRLPLGSRVP